ncbi:MAG: hypothetical protein V4555_05050 [Acidobacteriota bacterium]
MFAKGVDFLRVEEVADLHGVHPSEHWIVGEQLRGDGFDLNWGAHEVPGAHESCVLQHVGETLFDFFFEDAGIALDAGGGFVLDEMLDRCGNGVPAMEAVVLRARGDIGKPVVHY